MLAPADERITISSLTHNLSPSREVTTPGFTFPNQSVFAYQKPFLAAGMRGMGGGAPHSTKGCGCGGKCKGLGSISDNLIPIGLVAVAVMFLLPGRIKL